MKSLSLPAPIDRFAARCGRLAMTPRGMLAIWGTVLTILFVMRAFVFTGTDADDAEQSDLHAILGARLRRP